MQSRTSLALNPETPQIMHIDLNSAFATTEQQANPHLRGRPVGVTNRMSRFCCVIACSYEAKALGITTGMNLQEARALCPDFVMIETDPPKYRYMYNKLIGIMQSYTPKYKMKSIDEGLLDFHGTLGTVHHQSMAAIGLEIKQRLQDELGTWMRCNIGVAPNIWQAKLAAGLHKPDGLDIIDHTNVRAVYAGLRLVELPYIKQKMEARLNANNIFTPLQFLDAPEELLRKRVFKSVLGNDWYHKLRGYETDDRETNLGMVGRQYVLNIRTADDEHLLPRFQYLCQTTGMKLRFRGVDAYGLCVWARLQNGQTFAAKKLFKAPFRSDQDIYTKALYLLNKRQKHLVVATVGLYCYKLAPSGRNQVSLLDEINKAVWLTEAVDTVNEKFGGFTVTYASALEGVRNVKQKIPFNSTEYLQLLLNRQ